MVCNIWKLFRTELEVRLAKQNTVNRFTYASVDNAMERNMVLCMLE